MFQKMLQGGSGGGASTFQFSTDEQKTNLKWIDGKDIYCKTVIFDMPSKTYNYNHGIPIDTPLGAEGTIVVDGNISLLPNPYVFNASYATVCTLNRISVNIEVGSVYSSIGQVQVCLYYTKQ